MLELRISSARRRRKVHAHVAVAAVYDRRIRVEEVKLWLDGSGGG
jgi:hypothetical protein